ncbi:MAG: ABC transporter ATP-binding protein [Pseudomonadota bacterium]
MTDPERQIAVAFETVTKRYGIFTALQQVTLDIFDNEFFTLLGPSGCGKTTLLRSIAGFEDIQEGAIRLFGEEIAELPPNKRSVNTVFQNYALFPHMDVTENVMFGLRMLGTNEAEARKRVHEVLELVQLQSFADRMPSQLSGGQQQRVALARALAPNPRVLLLDEPLSALDLKLRQAVRLELQQLQKDTGITFIFVTHDQEEALTMSDRIAVISAGQVQQVGNAREIYEEPNNAFVASFIGETNLIKVDVADPYDGLVAVILPGGGTLHCAAAAGAHAGQGNLSIRPERLTFCPVDQAHLVGSVTRIVYLGTDMHVEVAIDGTDPIIARVQNTQGAFIPSIREAVGLKLDAAAARVLGA